MGWLPLISESPVLSELHRLIGQHFKTEPLSTFYAAQLGLPSRKLNDILRKTTGRLLPDLLENRRLAEAEALLALTRVLMKEIAYELGFASQSHFASFFRRRKGMSPAEFRKRAQQR